MGRLSRSNLEETCKGISTRDLSSYVTVPGSISNTGAGLFLSLFITPPPKPGHGGPKAEVAWHF